MSKQKEIAKVPTLGNKTKKIIYACLALALWLTIMIAFKILVYNKFVYQLN